MRCWTIPCGEQRPPTPTESDIVTPNLDGPRDARLGRVVRDLSAIEPQADHMSELAGVAEVHRMGRALDHRDRQMWRGEPTDLPYSAQRRHERVTRADHGERAHRRSQDAFERGEPHELTEQLQGVHGA